VFPLMTCSGAKRPTAPQPRDPGPPEAIDQTEEPPLEELAKFVATTEEMLHLLLGRDSQARQTAIDRLWLHLQALDQLVASKPESAPSHSLLLATLLIGLCHRFLTPEMPVAEVTTALEHLIAAVCTRLQVSRKDRERLKQILVAQRRMVHKGKRSRPTILARREYFPDAWQLFEMSCQCTQTNLEDLDRWRKLLGAKSKSPKGRRRRRRRRRPPPATQK
jgi:hypothetical protein